MWEDYQRFRPQFLEATDETLYPSTYLDALVYSGLAKFACTEDAAIVFEIKEYPSGARDIHFLLAAGNKQAIVNELRPQAEAWGREHGCIGSLVESRTGWARELKKFGYELNQCSVRKVF